MSLRTGWSIGWATFAISCVVLALWVPLRQRPGLGTVLNIIVISFALDVMYDVLPEPDGYGFRLLFVVVGIALIGLGSGLYLTAGHGPGPRDGLMTGLHWRTGWPVGPIRSCIEVSVLVVGWLLGGTVGVGTLLFALLIGQAVALNLRLVDRLYGPSAPLLGRDRVHDRVEHGALVLDLRVVVPPQAEATHDGEAALVRRVGDRDDTRQPERAEREVEPSGAGLRGVPATPVPGREAPRDLDVIGVRVLVVQPAHPEEDTVGATLDGEQPEAVLLVPLLVPLGKLVGVRSAQRRAAERLVHGRVGVEGCVRRQVVASEGPQQQPGRRRHQPAVPRRHRMTSRSPVRSGPRERGVACRCGSGGRLAAVRFLDQPPPLRADLRRRVHGAVSAPASPPASTSISRPRDGSGATIRSSSPR